MQNDMIKISPSIHEFLLTHGYTENFTVTPIAGAGSGRRYFRIASDERKSVQEDLGKRSLLDEAFPNDSKVLSGSARILYPEVIDALIQWQNASHQLFSHHTEIWLRRFDFAALKWESDYFTENYLKLHKGITEIPESVRNFYSLVAVSVEAQTKVLMHRDFQSQNIMIRPNSEVAFVDFQGARRGSMFYDIASLLWDPYVSLPLPMIKDFFEYWRSQYRGTRIYTMFETLTACAAPLCAAFHLLIR